MVLTILVSTLSVLTILVSSCVGYIIGKKITTLQIVANLHTQMISNQNILNNIPNKGEMN